MSKKLFSKIFVLLLVVGLLFAVAPTGQALAESALYVDDDFTESTEGWGVTHFATIQAAITAAAPGDTITVAVGTYAEQLVINKSLTLIGTDAVITPPTSIATYYLPAPAPTFGYTPMVFAYGGTMDGTGHVSGTGTISLNMSGFTIDGQNQERGTYAPGMLLRNVSGIISDNVIQNLSTPTSLDGISGIATYGDYNLIIHDNKISGFTYFGIVASGIEDPTSFATITNNFISTPGAAAPGTHIIGIVMESGANGLIQGNEIDGNDPKGDRASYGIELVTAGEVTIDSNIAYESKYGIYAYPSAAQVITNNNFYNNKFGVRVAECPATIISGNTIKNNWGIGIYLTDTTNAKIESNTIEDNTTGVYIPTGTGTTIKYNQFVNNNPLGTVDEYHLYSTPTVDVSLNYWGDPAGPNLALIGGNLDPVAPWYATATTTPTTQNVSVVRGTEIIAYSDTIQGAIDAASNGDTILVGPGTYDESLVIDVPNLTIKSTDSAATTIIETPAGSSKAVAFTDNLGTVTFEGFTVQNFTSAGIAQDSASVGTTARIIDNIVTSSGYYATNLIQVVGDNAVVSGNIITASGNPYPHHGSPGNTGIMVMNGSNVTVTGNTINGGVADRLGLDIAVYFWGYNLPVGTSMTGITFSGNTITNVNWLFDASGDVSLMPVSQNKFSDYNFVTWGEPPVDISANYWGSEFGPQAWYGGATINSYYTDAELINLVTLPHTINLSGDVSVPGGIHIWTPGLTYHLAAGTVIQNTSACFVIEASNTIIEAEPGAKCIPTGESNGIDVAADLNNITIDGLEIDGSIQTSGTADGIHFAGAVSDFVLVDNKIHNMLGDGIEFVGAPTGVVDIAGNLFQNNAGLGINAGTYTVTAQYNSWGSFAGPDAATGGDGISSGVNATPFTHADVTLSPINGTTNRVVTSLANVSGRPTVLKDGTLYHLWYGPTDTTLYHSTSTNPAEFPAGEEVTFSTTAPLEVSSTAIFKEGETFYMVAYNGTNNKAFALYSSTDGTAWTFVGQIFDATTPLMDDLGKIDAPFVFNDDGTFKLYFQKKSALGDRYDIYLASSTTVDGSYTLNATNPVLSPTEGAWDGSYVMHPWVVKDGATYYMWYSAYISTSPQIKIGLATSTDGVNWVKNETNPMIGPSTSKPTVINDDGTWRIWYFTGGIKYQTALSPLDLRQTLAYQVTANLVNVNSADVTITYPTGLLTIAELTSGTEIPGTFDTSVAGQISYVGAKLEKTTTTGEDVVLFNAIFLNKALGSGDIAFGLAEFGMPGHLSSSNVYLAAEADTAEVEIKELPFLTTDLDSAYYLTGEPKTFTVTITNYGTAYTGAVLNLTLPTGVTVDGVPASIDLAVSESQTLTLTFTSTTPGEKTIGFDLKDSSGALLFSTVETATVYDAPTITSTDIQGYYLTGEQRQFSVVLDNPTAGANYAHVYVDFTLTNAQVEHINSIEYSVDNGTTWVTLGGTGTGTSYANSGTDIVGYFGKIDGGGFPLAPGVSLTTLFRVTFVTRTQDPTDFPTSYAVSMQLRDADALPASNLLDELTDTMYVYDAPVITPIFPTGPYVAGVPVTVSISITNPSGIPGPFELVLDLPDGTTFTFAGQTYTCTDTGCPPITVTLPLATSDLVITFDEGYEGSIGFSLYDSDWTPEDRLLASYYQDGVKVLGAFDVNGTVSMQGRSAREGVKLILTGTPGTYDATSTSLISNNYVIEDVAEGIYTFTTYQPRYLNITADEDKTLTLSGAKTLNSLWLRGGNAMWYETVDGVEVLDNVIDHLDSGMIANGYTGGIIAYPDADVNFDGIISIQDLALVGGNYFLDSETAYFDWVPVTPSTP